MVLLGYLWIVVDFQGVVTSASAELVMPQELFIWQKRHHLKKPTEPPISSEDSCVDGPNTWPAKSVCSHSLKQLAGPQPNRSVWSQSIDGMEWKASGASLVTKDLESCVDLAMEMCLKCLWLLESPWCSYSARCTTCIMWSSLCLVFQATSKSQLTWLTCCRMVLTCLNSCWPKLFLGHLSSEMH